MFHNWVVKMAASYGVQRPPIRVEASVGEADIRSPEVRYDSDHHADHRRYSDCWVRRWHSHSFFGEKKRNELCATRIGDFSEVASGFTDTLYMHNFCLPPARRLREWLLEAAENDEDSLLLQMKIASGETSSREIAESTDKHHTTIWRRQQNHLDMMRTNLIESGHFNPDGTMISPREKRTDEQA